MTLHKHETQWRRLMARVDEQAAATWQHPGDAIDAREHEVARGGHDLRCIIYDCLPSRSQCGGLRGVRAGYIRWCAYAYRLAPEVFEGLHGKTIAAALGITHRAWKMHLTKVDAALRVRRANGQK